MAKRKAKQKKLSLTKKPEDLSLDDWQLRLRQDLGATGRFRLLKEGRKASSARLTTFRVRNLENRREYGIELHGTRPHDNFCACPDYSINSLGTCKHIEFALRILRKQPETRRALDKGITPLNSEIELRYGTIRRLQFRPGRRLTGPALKFVQKYFTMDGEGYFASDVATFPFEAFVTKFRTFEAPLRIRADVEKLLGEIRARKQASGQVNALFPQGIRSTAWRDLLKVDLYPYQKEGALFAALRGRSVIADEMGLGKTLQAIAAAEILRQATGLQKVLIVCPTSLKHQWKIEIDRSSGLSVEIIDGLSGQRKQLLATPTFFKIVNYDIVHRDLSNLNDWKPDLVILDEAQRIKNWKTKAAQAVKKLDSRFCLVLTGTPLENRVEELHSLVEFVDQFHFGPLFRFIHEHQLTDVDGKVIGYTALDKINERLKEILIRRTKKEVLSQLPPRTDKTLLLPMQPQQTAMHEEHAHTVAQIVTKWRKFHFLNDKDQRRLMSALQFMRMSCNSTYLLDGETNHQTKVTELVKILRDLLASQENKVVVFSQWLRTHELIIEQAEKRKWGLVFFHGSLSGRKRKEAIENFMGDPNCRIFLATDAGGVGLNLQRANVVVNFDQPWNPAVLEQRIGRIHRLGQTRPVQVFNLVAQGTIEEGILRTLDFKRAIFSGVLDGKQSEVLLGSSRMGRFIESVEEATRAQKLPSSPVLVPAPSASAKARDQATASPFITKEVAAPQNPWEPLLQAGLQLLRGVTQGANSSATSHSMIFEKDKETGETFLKIKAPPPEIIATVAACLQDWLKPVLAVENENKKTDKPTRVSEAN